MGVRLNKVLSELNIGLETAVDFLKAHQELGEIRDDANYVTKISDSQYEALVKVFKGDENDKSNAELLFPWKSKDIAPKTKVGKTDFDSINQEARLGKIASLVEDTTSIRRIAPVGKTAHVEKVEPPTENERKQYLTKKEVLVRVREIARGEDVPQKKEVDYLKTAFYKLHIAEREARLKEYIDGGGAPETYQILPDEDEEAFKVELGVIKEKRREHFTKQELEREENLKKKLDIIEQIKAMVTSPEKANKSYKEFKALQKEWREIKNVPTENTSDLWRNYQLWVELYYDLLRLHKEQENVKQESRHKELEQNDKPREVTETNVELLNQSSHPKTKVRLNKVLSELNISLQTAVDYLRKKKIGELPNDATPNTRISYEQYRALINEFADSKNNKRETDDNNPNDEKGTNSFVKNACGTSFTPLRGIGLDNNAEKNLEGESPKEVLSEATQLEEMTTVCDQSYDVFVSYSRKNSSQVQFIVNELQNKGYKIWIDKDGIESGDAFKAVIVKAIKKAEVFIFFSSIEANKSPWTVKEVNVAVHLKKIIIPVKLDNSEYDDSVLLDLAGLDFIDLTDEAKHDYAVNKLVKALKKKISNIAF